MSRKSDKRSMISWAFYDWANSAFATTIMAGFFPVFFRSYWNRDADDTTLKLGIGHAVIGLTVAVIAPLCGAIADRMGKRKVGVMVFAALGVACSAAMVVPSQGQWFFGLLLFVGATIGFACGNSFYDSLLVDVCRPSKHGVVSALGYGLGYLGGGILFAVNLWMFTSGKAIGIPDEAWAIKLSFLTVAAWWAVFSLPLFFFTRERIPVDPPPVAQALRQGLGQLLQTVRELVKNRNLRLFIIAYFFYIDGVNTVIKMAVNFCLENKIVGVVDAMAALLLVQLIAFPAAIIYGKLGSKYGAKAGVLVGIVAYTVLTTWSIFMRTRMEFYGLAVCLALVQGGVQALSRSIYSGMIPEERAAEYFGIYNVLGKFESILGPVLVAVTAHFGNKHLGMASLVPLFIIGALVLARVDTSNNVREPIQDD